ncbi:hypothetical protein P692DRAFT_20752259 [Suillus brevipes Sb2]|nr:hypothetical protein P692DRAFT_20752259 [Suillus brevipes Sb2]
MGSSSTLLLPVAPSLLSQPPALTPVSGPLGKKLRKRGPPCAGAFCHRARALRCIRGMCLKHCIEAGGCANERLVDNQGFGYEDLQLALKVSLAAQGLEVPSAPPPSLHDILTSVPGPSAPSTLTVRKPLKQPRITNQLDPVWALDLRARAQQEIDEGRIAERRKEMERAAKQRFVLNWFDADDEPVMMQWVSNCPFFPQYQLSDDSILIESLGTDISKIDVYEERYARWIPAPLSHTFTLTTGGHIFIRRHGVTQCEGFDELYRASKQSVRPPHMRSNMKGQRDALRATAKQSHRTVTADCDSDLEILEVKPLTNKATGKRQVWPHGMYTVDMATGFRQLDNPMLRGTLRQDQLFKTIFGVPYVKATYHQNHRTWIDANPTIRETHERAGRKPAGLWRSFLSAHRITRGEQSKKSKKSL